MLSIEEIEEMIPDVWITTHETRTAKGKPFNLELAKELYDVGGAGRHYTIQQIIEAMESAILLTEGK